jgi:dehydrogenase/reductase SDR family protein 12
MQLVARVVDASMESTVVPSFTRIGLDVRRRLFHWAPLPRVGGRVMVVTGATSGLGFAMAERLAGLGAHVVMVARDEKRGGEALARVLEAHPEASAELAIGDLSDLGSVRALADTILDRHARLDALIHNAGVLVHERKVTDDGFELTFATHVVGPFLLTRLLLPALERSDDARLVTMASGGMYSVPLSLEDLQSEAVPFKGSRVYARAKRAQVLLAEQWAKKLAGTTVTVATMHPGWADTPGIVTALPRFHKLLQPLLRTPEEGADTGCWLATAPEVRGRSGRFWLDRGERSTHKLPSTRKGDHLAPQLWDVVEAYTAPTHSL